MWSSFFLGIGLALGTWFGLWLGIAATVASLLFIVFRFFKWLIILIVYIANLQQQVTKFQIFRHLHDDYMVFNDELIGFDDFLVLIFFAGLKL
jgi:predicted exporter